MSYFFPHQTREALRQKTIDDFEKHSEALSDIQEQMAIEIAATIPLWEDLFSMGFEKGKDDWEFDQWRDVYIKHGWNEVKGEPRLRRIVNMEESDILKGKFKEEFIHDKRSDKWTEFTKEIDGALYRRAFPDDKQMLWSFFVANSNRESFQKRQYLMRDASYELDCLEYFTSIYLHEAFLIMLGVSIDDMDRSEFRSWMIGGYFKNKQFDLPEWFKHSFIDFKEWKILQRRFGKGKKVTGLSITKDWKAEFNTIEIDTQEFIEWALKIGIIEEDTAHFRDGREAPFEVSFTEMLHKELIAKKLIKQGKHHHTWVWASTKNAYSYLIRSLFINQMPKQYWIDEPLNEQSKKNNVRWEPWQHYFGKDISRPENQTTIPSNSPTIDLIVEELFIEHDKGNINDFK